MPRELSPVPRRIKNSFLKALFPSWSPLLVDSKVCQFIFLGNFGLVSGFSPQSSCRCIDYSFSHQKNSQVHLQRGYPGSSTINHSTICTLHGSGQITPPSQASCPATRWEWGHLSMPHGRLGGYKEAVNVNAPEKVFLKHPVGVPTLPSLGTEKQINSCHWLNIQCALSISPAICSFIFRAGYCKHTLQVREI